MPIVAHDLGPGTLILGSGPLDVTLQVTSCKVTTSENVQEFDDIKVLNHDTLDGGEDVTFSHVLTGTFLQDLVAGGVVAWSWTNAGTEQAFTFVPNTAAARQVQGVLKPVHLDIGGDEMAKKMDTPFTWRIVGTPDFEAAA